MWAVLGHTNTIAYESWPEYDEAKTVSNEITLPIQFNGKLKATIQIEKDEDENLVKEKVHNTIDSKLVINQLLRKFMLKIKFTI